MLIEYINEIIQWIAIFILAKRLLDEEVRDRQG